MVISMGSCRKLLIDQKIFELKRENDLWWRITESSHRVVKFISIDVAAMDWLASAVGACGVADGSSEFFRTHRKGNQGLVVQQSHNSFGRFLTLFEFGHEKRRGLIVVLEGLKGEAWRRFGEALKEASSYSSVLGEKNRVRRRLLHLL